MRKEYIFKIELNTEDAETLNEIAKEVNLTPDELLQYFINDLVNGEESSGSDERRLANEWYQRNFPNWVSILDL